MLNYNYNSKGKQDVGGPAFRWKDVKFLQRTEQVSTGIINGGEEEDNDGMFHPASMA